VRQRGQQPRKDAEAQAGRPGAMLEQVAERQERDEDQEIEEQLRLRVPRLEDEVPEGDDEGQVRRDERRQVPREDRPQQRKQDERQADVPPLADLEELVGREARIVEQRQKAGKEANDQDTMLTA